MIRFIGLAATFILASTIALVAPVHAQGINIESGTIQGGTLETRSDPIRIGDEVSVNGDIGSRNGSITIGDQVTARGVTTRNGSISIGQGGQFEAISTRNGSIRIGSGNQTAGIDSRNGQISIGPDSRTGDLISRNGTINIGSGVEVDGNARTRNGAIRVQDNARVSGSVITRNGRITLASGSQVSGTVGTRNGNIDLDHAAVVEGLESRTGDLVLDNASRVNGDVVIEVDEESASGGRFLWFGRSSDFPDAGNIRILGGSEVGGDIVVILPEDYDGKAPVVEIEAGSVVHGSLRLDRRVELVNEGTTGVRTEP
jgi:hypothetical protein